MSITASESSSPTGESQANERKERLVHLAWMVFNLMAERHLGETNHEFDGVEDASLIAALRVCGYYSDQIGCSDFGDTLVVQVKGIDGHEYIVQFTLLEPRISIHVARVQVTKLPMVGREGQAESTYNRMNVLQEHSKRLKFGKLTTDRVFLIGMSLVISFMDDEDDDPDEDARLAPLTVLVRPTDEELREIWAKKLPPSTINYDDEVDMPY
jgi:hypothetical protein